MGNENLIEKLAAQFGQNASVKNVYAEPVRADDKTIIPVAQIAYGLGGGHGIGKKIRAPKEIANADQDIHGEGGGAGVEYLQDQRECMKSHRNAHDLFRLQVQGCW